MNYYLYQLTFTTPVHFGEGGSLSSSKYTCESDTLFGALCNEAELLQAGGAAELIEKAESGDFLISGLFPFFETKDTLEIYLPRPMYPVVRDEKRKSLSFSEMKTEATAIKKFKKIEYIRASELKAYLSGETMSTDIREFGASVATVKVNTRGVEPLPYTVGGYAFNKAAGLYFIAGLTSQEDVETLSRTVISLGHTGIGGKRSSGYGKFVLNGGEPYEIDDMYDDMRALETYLNDAEAPIQMALSSCAPRSEEISIVKAGTVGLERRGGYIWSSGAHAVRKRDNYYALKPGSCLPKRLKGQCLYFSYEGLPYTVCRNGKGLFLGVKV